MGLRKALGLKAQKKISGSPQAENLDELHFSNCIVLSNRSELLRRLPKGGVVAEIGVADGDYSQEILALNEPSKLLLIDSWGSDRYAGGLASVQTRFATEIASGSVEVRRGISISVLADLPPDSVDLAYIDTNHEYLTTASELRLCSTLVRDGGRIAGHDFCKGNPAKGLAYGVIRAVFEFCAKHNWRFEYITLDGSEHFSFCLVRA